MQKLLKFKHLITIVLLSYSTNLLANSCDTIPSTGGEDSILIAYNDLRKVNSKLVELKYEKEINKNLKNIISNDSIAIAGLHSRISDMDRIHQRNIRKLKKERNVAGGIGIGAIILLIISIL